MKKLFSLFFALCILLSLAACGKEIPPDGTSSPTQAEIQSTAPSSQPEDETTLPSQATQPAESTPAENVPYLTAYKEAIEAYRSAIQFRTSPQWNYEVPSSLAGGAVGEALSLCLAELPSTDGTTEADYGYILYDLNGDGTPELFWVRADHSIVAVFTYYQNQLTFLDASWSRYYGFISPMGQLCYSGANGAVENYRGCFVLQEGKLVEVFRVTCQYAEQFTETDPQFHSMIYVSQERYEELIAEISESRDFWLSCTRYPVDRAPSLSDVTAPDAAHLPYIQKVRRADQSIHAGPGYDYPINGTVEQAGSYTITTQITDWEGFLWGRLKSGAGWINLSEIRQQEDIQLSLTANFADKTLLNSGNFHRFTDDASPEAICIAVRAYENLTDLTLYIPDYSVEQETWTPVYTQAQIGSEKPLVADLSLPGDMSYYGVSFKDSAGALSYYRLYLSGRDGSVCLDICTEPNILQS